MNAISTLQQGLQWAHELLEMVMDDVTPEQLVWEPPGIANPVGALYVHAVAGEDGVVNALLRGGAPLFATDWADKTGASEPRFDMTLEWARSLQVDLPACREYAQAVYAATDGYLTSLTPDDLTGEVDLTGVNLGKRPLGWCLNALVIAHLNNMAGEISCLKGIQGAKGYPF
ncbi:MAG: DinB family protein [Anaerolineae bacterium]|nr:DinB family protein [Anaerolineae bacterium]